MKKYLAILLCSFVTYAETNTILIKLNPVSGLKVIEENNPNLPSTINPICNNEVFGQCTEGESQYTSAIGANVVTWNCTSNNLTVSCSKTADSGINGVCGSSNNTALSSIPTENLCNTGNPSFVTETSTNYNWSCSGDEGTQTTSSGNIANCSALKPSPSNSIETQGWLHFANFGMNFYVDDNTWQNAVTNMKFGIKVVNKKSGQFSFISASKLLNGNCTKISNITSLTTVVTTTKLWWYENSGCSGSGLDYSMLNLKTSAPVYDYSSVKWDIKHCTSAVCNFTDHSDTKFYIL